MGNPRAWCGYLMRVFLLHHNMIESSHGETKQMCGVESLLHLKRPLISSSGPTDRISSNSNYLPNAPPPSTLNMWIWGLSFQFLNFWGHIQIIASTLKDMTCVLKSAMWWCPRPSSSHSSRCIWLIVFDHCHLEPRGSCIFHSSLAFLALDWIQPSAWFCFKSGPTCLYGRTHSSVLCHWIPSISRAREGLTGWLDKWRWSRTRCSRQKE